MGKKYIMDRPFFSDRERFAELVNAVLYGGRQILLPVNLVLHRRKYPSLSSAGGESERDVLMEDAVQNICYGIEIETESDYSMPERVINYDVCDYGFQMRELDRGHRAKKDYSSYRERKSRMKKSDFLCPVVTIVLYLGEGHWEGGQKLSQMFHLSSGLRELLGTNLHDYDFPLIEADFVDPALFDTDLRAFFQAMQCRRDRDKLKDLLQTQAFRCLSSEAERVIARHLHIKSLICRMEKEELPMCKAFDDLMKEERSEGKREGKREEKLRIIRQMAQAGFEETMIRRITKCTREELAAVGR